MNCDAIAGWYRWFEYLGFGRALERRRSAFLAEVSDARRVLVLGDGDGRALQKLVRTAPGARIDAVDLSGRMLALAKTRAGTERVTYYEADALAFPLVQGTYDLVVTHFFLDCLDATEAGRLIERVSQSCKPDARWLISEFREPAWWARAWVGALYLFFRLTTGLRTRRLVDHRPMLEKSRFHPARIEPAWGGLLASELWVR